MDPTSTNEHASDSSISAESLTLVTESESEHVIVKEPDSNIVTCASPSVLKDCPGGKSWRHVAGHPSSSKDAMNSKRTKQQPLRFDTPTWYMNPCFSRYWKHYSKVMQWCQKHYQTVQFLERSQATMSSAMTAQYCNPKYWNAYFNWLRNSSQPTQTASTTNTKKVSKKKRKRAKKNSLKDKRSQGHESVEDMSYEEGDSHMKNDEEFEMEITEEMKEFFAHSERHRQERGKGLILACFLIGKIILVT